VVGIAGLGRQGVVGGCISSVGNGRTYAGEVSGDGGKEVGEGAVDFDGSLGGGAQGEEGGDFVVVGENLVSGFLEFGGAADVESTGANAGDFSPGGGKKMAEVLNLGLRSSADKSSGTGKGDGKGEGVFGGCGAHFREPDFAGFGTGCVYGDGSAGARGEGGAKVGKSLKVRVHGPVAQGAAAGEVGLGDGAEAAEERPPEEGGGADIGQVELAEAVGVYGGVIDS